MVNLADPTEKNKEKTSYLVFCTRLSADVSEVHSLLNLLYRKFGLHELHLLDCNQAVRHRFNIHLFLRGLQLRAMIGGPVLR